MEKAIYTRPPLDILACTNSECDLYGEQNQGNLRVRKVYGREQIRYLRCVACKEEFSERRGTALWNCKMATFGCWAVFTENCFRVWQSS
jgi:hypothetical protein